MRVGIEASCLADRQPTGIPRYTRHLLLALAALPDAAAELVMLYRGPRWRRPQFPVHARLRRQLWRGAWWPLRRDFDIVHSTQHRLPPWRGPRKIATIHDLYPLLGINLAHAAERGKHERIYRDLAARADHLIFVSHHTRRDFQRLVGGDAACQHVTPLGVTPDFRPHDATERARCRARFGLTGPYLLFVGWHQPNKNLARLLDAFGRSALARTHVLALAGRAEGPARAALEQRIAAAGLTGRVRLLGFVAEAELPGLYASAEALLFPSLYEGFGLPILEAMASGIPVLTSTTTSCPEVANGHAVLVEPQDVDDIARGIAAAVATSPAAREAARAYAQSCTWERTARATLAVYERALRDAPRGAP